MTNAAPNPVAPPPGALGDFLIGIGAAAVDYVARRQPAWPRRIRYERFAAIGRGAAVLTESAAGARIGLYDLVVGDPAANAEVDVWRGRFADLRYERAANALHASADQFATLPIYYSARADELLLASDLRLLLDAPWCGRDADPAAIYHLLNFGYIPAPLTVVSSIRRLLPAEQLEFIDGRLSTRRYWSPRYAEDLDGNENTLAGELEERIVATVQRYRPSADAGWGCFLSGGTDSSSITSILARQFPQRRVPSFSIGFAEAGYDELDFARMAAQACGAEAHTRSVSRDDTLALMPTLIELCDQPFGNASTIPTHVCAALAHDNAVSTLIAGDGGDEIFGGNERYAKDRALGLYYALPAPLKTIGGAIGRVAARSGQRLAQRVANFAERGALPNPDRFYTDDSFASDYFRELLDDGFAASVPRDLSLDFLRGLYAQSAGASELHRLMRLDLDMAIAQCDIVKVHSATRAAGVAARFPYLDPDLVEYTGRLRAHWKVQGFDKRRLFKRAMQNVLPAQILTKKKQGFGLPIAVWFARDAAFREITHDAVLGERARRRGWFKPAFVEELLRQHEAGTWDWSAEIWRLVTLELWLRRYLDR